MQHIFTNKSESNNMFVYQKGLITTFKASFFTTNKPFLISRHAHKLNRLFCNQKPVLYAGFKISDIQANPDFL